MSNFNKTYINTNILKVGSKKLDFENWKVYHPTGRYMFTCGEKKAHWYLDRNLAIIFGKKKIKLTFIPKGNGFEDNEVFGRSSRELKCVVTGLTNNLQRHHIVPYCYRTLFPEKYKSKNHHDVVLINYEIHADYEQLANQYKDEIAKIYKVKTIAEYNIDYTTKLREIGKSNSILLSYIHSLFKCYKIMNENVRLNKLKYISDNSNIPYNVISRYSYVQFYKLYILLTEQHIKEIDTFKDNYRYLFDHGYHVVQKLDSEEKIEEFVKLWRNHFINTMQPKYMPNGWSINFRIKTKIL